jgi:hypothetical protein
MFLIMKKHLLTLICIFIISPAFTQDYDITGIWEIVEMTSVSPQGSETMPEDQMKLNGSVTDFYFMGKGKFKQVSNMSGPGTLDTFQGSWKTAGNKLTISMNRGGRIIDMDYKYEMRGALLVLSRTSPDGKIKVTNTFREKPNP